MLSYYEQELSETQAGFRKDNWTRDQIMNMRLICEKQIEHNKTVYCCFIDYSKAFDGVDFELMWRTLLYFGIPKYLVECLKYLYQNQTAEVETAVGRTGPLSVQRGVRQGCPLSPMLFNLYSELIMRHALDKWEDGIETGGKFCNYLRYPDDESFKTQALQLAWARVRPSCRSSSTRMTPRSSMRMLRQRLPEWPHWLQAPSLMQQWWYRRPRARWCISTARRTSAQRRRPKLKLWS